jgi:hypothetical protein
VAADYVLRMGGTVVVDVEGQRREVKAQDELPPTGRPLWVVEADLRGITVTDAGAEHFRDLAQLEALRLGDCPLLSDGVVDPLLGLPRLRRLELSGCRVSAKGVAMLVARLPALQSLAVERMPGWSNDDRARVATATTNARPSCTVSASP